KFDKTLDCIKKMRNLNQQTGNRQGLASAYAWEGNIWMVLGKYKESLKQYDESIRIRKEIQDETGLASDYANVAIEYQMLSDYTTALKYHRECYRLAKKNNNKYGLLLYLKDMGRL